MKMTLEDLKAHIDWEGGVLVIIFTMEALEDIPDPILAAWVEAYDKFALATEEVYRILDY